MTATFNDIKGWLEEGNDGQNTHMIVAHDTYDHSNYPVYVTKDQSVQAEKASIEGKSMQKVDEVYDYSLPIEDQLQETRAMHC